MSVEQHSQARHVMVLEAWMGGSHANFLHAWQGQSRHRIQVEGLAARHWKWRMSAAAWELARRLEPHPSAADVLFVTDYVDLSQLPSFLPPAWSKVPRVYYMHENQLTYPVTDQVTGAGTTGQPTDTSWGFKNVLSCLAAERVLFNSEYHRREFANAADQLLRTLPRPTPRAALAEVLGRAAVVAPGIDWQQIPLGQGGAEGAPLRILFNHRWEHDKDPARFLRAVAAVHRAGLPVEIMALGPGSARPDASTRPLLEELADCFCQRGFIEERKDYLEALGTCDLVVSTARHEFYGIAVLEALGAGCTPLLPDRLVYPEVLPGNWHAQGLYRGTEDLVRRLTTYARDPRELRGMARRREIRGSVRAHGVDRTAAKLDELVSELALGGR